MANTWYAWSNFLDADGKKVKPGDEVSPELLGVDEEEWQEYVDAGVVRTKEHPPVKGNESPREYNLRKANEMAEGLYTNDPDQSEDKPEESKRSGWAR